MNDRINADPLCDADGYRSEQDSKPLLRFLTCGSVDDGKSTLIGRLLYDTKSLFEDQLSTLERESAQYGTTGDEMDFALLVDGLDAEREQGITIDVAYRFLIHAKTYVHHSGCSRSPRVYTQYGNRRIDC